MKKIRIKVEKTNTGFAAISEEHPVCTTGSDFNEIRTNMVEAMNLYFEFEDPARVVSTEDFDLQLDLSSFFEFYKVINAKAFSNRVGMNQSLLAQYIKGKKKPSKAQTARILKGVKELGRELSEIRF
jgi:predicted RNase H-like HicB family nuclease